MIQSGKQYVAGLSEDKADKGADGKQGLSSAEQRRLQKEKEAEERRMNRKKKSLEEAISEREAEIEELEKELLRGEIMTDHVKLTELGEQLTRAREALDKNYEEWLELQG